MHRCRAAPQLTRVVALNAREAGCAALAQTSGHQVHVASSSSPAETAHRGTPRNKMGGGEVLAQRIARPFWPGHGAIHPPPEVGGFLAPSL